MAYNLYQRDPRFPIGSVYQPDDELAASEYDARRPSLSALLPKPDPGLDEQWRQAEQSALERSQPKTEYGAAEAVRDFAPMAVGSILDILVNHGHGLGALAAGGMQALGDEQTRRDNAQKAAASQALAIRQQRESGADRAINAEHAMLRAAELEQRIAEMRAKGMSPEMARQAAEAELDLKRAQAEKMRADAKYAGIDDLIRYMSMQSGAQRDAAQKAFQERVLTLKEQEAANKKAENEQKAADRAEQERVRSEEKAAAIKRGNIETFNRVTKPVQDQARAVRDLDQLIRPFINKDIPGQGVVDQWIPNRLQDYLGSDTAAATSIDQKRKLLHTFFVLESTGKQNRADEQKNAAIAYGLRDGATEQELMLGLNGARQRLREMLQSAGSPYQADAREALRAGDLEDFVYGPTFQYTWGAPGQSAPQQPSAAPQPQQPPPPPAASASPSTAPSQAQLPDTAEAPNAPARPSLEEVQRRTQALLKQVFPDSRRRAMEDSLRGVDPYAALWRLEGILKQPEPDGSDTTQSEQQTDQFKTIPTDKLNLKNKAQRDEFLRRKREEAGVR